MQCVRARVCVHVYSVCMRVCVHIQHICVLVLHPPHPFLPLPQSLA